MKLLVRALSIFAVLLSFSALIYSTYAYFLFDAAADDSENLYSYVNSQTKEFSLKGLNSYSDRVIKSNPVLDSINSVLFPYYTGVRYYDFDRENSHKLDNHFSVQELSILSRSHFLSRILPQNHSDRLKEFDNLYDNGYQDYPDFLRYKAGESTVFCFIIFITWVVFSIMLFKSTSQEIYKRDFIFIRYSWSNESSIIGRRLVSLVLNSTFAIAFIITIILPFSIEIYSSSSEFSDNVMALLGLCAFVIFTTWALTSLGWWVFDKKKNSIQS
jgi:hypothetical protein